MISNALPANHAPLAGESSAHQAVNKFAHDTDRSAEVVSVSVDDKDTSASALLTGKQKRHSKRTVTGKQKGLPKAKGTPPPTLKGYTWRADGSGWQARRLWTDDNGKRHQTYVAHLSREAFGKLRQKHRKPDGLAAALAQWISEREKEKGDL